MRRRIAGPLVGGAMAALGFVAGSWWHAELLVEPPSGPSPAPIATAPTGADGSPHLPPSVPPPPASTRGAVEPVELERCKGLAGAFRTVSDELAAAKTELRQRDDLRTAREGTPVPFEAKGTEPRFAPEKLRDAVAEAFTQSRVPGRVQGLDCAEWPCIVYGRLRGAEDQMEKLEGAKALAAYESDISTVLLWAATDEAAKEGPLPLLPGRPEQSLFALAFYPRGLDRPVADNLDRRLRTRTAELWNTLSPADETGH